MPRAARLAHRGHMIDVDSQRDRDIRPSSSSLTPAASCVRTASATAATSRVRRLRPSRQLRQRLTQRGRTPLPAPAGSSKRPSSRSAQAVTQHVEQALLEQAQLALQRGRQRAGRRAQRVVIEQLRLRIVAHRQLQDQFAQVPGRHQPSRGSGPAAPAACVDLRAGQPRRFATSCPGHQQRHEGLQHTGQSRIGAAHARANTRQAAVVAREQLEDPAAVAPGTLVQQEGAACAPRAAWLLIPRPAAAAPARCRPSPRAPSPTGSGAGAGRAARSARAAPRVPTRFRRSPRAPMTMGFWPARSTQITADTTSWPSLLARAPPPPRRCRRAAPRCSSSVSFSRMISAMRKSWPRSVSCSGGKQRAAIRAGAARSAPRRRCMSPASSADTGTISAKACRLRQLAPGTAAAARAAAPCRPCSPPR